MPEPKRDGDEAVGCVKEILVCVPGVTRQGCGVGKAVALCTRGIVLLRRL